MDPWLRAFCWTFTSPSDGPVTYPDGSTWIRYPGELFGRRDRGLVIPAGMFSAVTFPAS